jgi:hypothetical protein
MLIGQGAVGVDDRAMEVLEKATKTLRQVSTLEVQGLLRITMNLQPVKATLSFPIILRVRRPDRFYFASNYPSQSQTLFQWGTVIAYDGYELLWYQVGESLVRQTGPISLLGIGKRLKEWCPISGDCW